MESHAQASRVRVFLHQVNNRLNLYVADNGVGFVPPADLPQARTSAGGGLASIAERMHQLGGSLAVRSQPGHGT